MNVPVAQPRLATTAVPSQNAPGTIELDTVSVALTKRRATATRFLTISPLQPQLHDWHEDLEQDSHYQLAKTILCHTNPNIVLASRDAKIKDDMSGWTSLRRVATPKLTLSSLSLQPHDLFRRRSRCESTRVWKVLVVCVDECGADLYDPQIQALQVSALAGSSRRSAVLENK